MATVFPFWARPGSIVERTAFATDVIQKRSGKEQRISLRSSPRRSWDITVWTNGPRDVAYLQTLLFDSGDTQFLLPIWPYAGFVAAPVTGGASAVQVLTDGVPWAAGDEVLLWRDPWTWEHKPFNVVSPAGTVNVSTPFLTSWSLGTVVAPLRLGRVLAEPETSWHAVAHGIAPVRFDLQSP